LKRSERAESRRADILSREDPKQSEFLEFILSQYVAEGEQELDDEKLPTLLNLKYGTAGEAVRRLGSVSDIRQAFRGFQQELYRRD
jgi:type I restriction enzyme R subunit